MKLVPARLESLAKFIERAPNGKLLVPNDPKARPYGGSPYENMKNGAPRVFARYKLPKGLRSMDRVVVIGFVSPLDGERIRVAMAGRAGKLFYAEAPESLLYGRDLTGFWSRKPCERPRLTAR